MINIGDKARIRKVDDRNFTLEQKRAIYNAKTKTTRCGWVHVGFYSNIKSALLGALKHLSNDIADEEVTVREVLGKLDGIEAAILGATNLGE